LYPEVAAAGSKKVKFGIARDKDPLDLWGKAKTFLVPAGCIVIWNERMVHGHSKTPVDYGAEYGLYVGFTTEGSRSEYLERTRRLMKETTFTEEEVRLRKLEEFKSTGITELGDRLRSFIQGDSPLLYKSLDPTRYFPKKFYNFPKILGKRIEKLDDIKIPVCPSTGVRMLTTRVDGKGNTVPHLLPVRNTLYRTPQLTPLGNRLLGLDSWDDTWRGDADSFSQLKRPRTAWDY
jgi:hypothetical protein